MYRLRKRGNVWYYDIHIDGKRHKGSTYCESKELATKVAKKKFSEIIELGSKVGRGRIKTINFINEHLRLCNGNISNEWLRNKGYLLNQFLIYVQNKIRYLDEIDISLLEEFRSYHLSKSAKPTVKNLMVVVGSMLKHAVKLGYIRENPCKKLESIRGIQKNKLRFLSKDEIEDVLDATKESYLKDFVKTAIYTGMRRSELLNLEYDDIDLKRKLIYVRNKTDFQTKSRKERVLPLHNKLSDMFVNQENGYCFTRNGEKIHEDTATRNFKTIMIGIHLNDVGLHTLRHTFISHCLMFGINVWEVGKWVGHNSSYITELYGHLCKDRREIDKLEF